jgi:Cu(I)/Ag(I) efflux system membrane fusion protein
MKHLIYLAIAFAATIAVNACSKPASDNKKEAESTVVHAGMAVSGNCEMCKQRIESAAKAVRGVISAEWDGDTQQLHLNFDTVKTSLPAIGIAIATAGHDAGQNKAPDGVYNALSECCKYKAE